jgi:hypothetical protein
VIIFGSNIFGGYGLTCLRRQPDNAVHPAHICLFDSIGKMYHIGFLWYQLYCGTPMAQYSWWPFLLPDYPGQLQTKPRRPIARNLLILAKEVCCSFHSLVRKETNY